MAPKRKVLAASCVMLFIGPLLAAFQCCGLLFQCCGLLLALRNAFLDIVQHNSFSTCSADQEHLFCFFDVDEDAPEFCFLFAVFDFVIETTSFAAFSSKGMQSFVLCLCFLICKLLTLFIFWCRLL
jgi:hypothetical protein